jgi:hypothetical protein
MTGIWEHLGSIAPSEPAPAPQEALSALDKVEHFLKTNGREESYNGRVAAALAATYTKVVDSRSKLIREVDKMRQFYMTDVIINQICEDAISPEVGSGRIIKVSSPNATIQAEIDALRNRVDFDALIQSVVPDLMSYGEYVVSTKIAKVEKGVQVDPTTVYGVEEIRDDVEQGSVVAVANWNDTLGFLAQDPRRGTVVWKEPSDFIRFTLSSVRMRIDLHKEYGADRLPKTAAGKDIPRFVRVGRSVVYPIIPKLKELELLEALVPATKLSKLSSGSIVGVQVPAGYDVQKAMEAARQMEQLVNKKVGVDSKLGELTIENIMSAAGRIKVIPMFGDKGQTQKLDYKSEEPDEMLASVRDIRSTICTSVGVPYEIVFGGEDEKRSVTLKKYARYLRRLKAIQKALDDGIRELIYIHLVNKGIDFKEEDVKTEFFNKLIEIDNLDKLEFMDTTIQFVDNAKKFVFELASPEANPYFGEQIRFKALASFINEQLNVVGFPNIIDPNYLKGPEDPRTPPPQAKPPNVDVPSDETPVGVGGTAMVNSPGQVPGMSPTGTGVYP